MPCAGVSSVSELSWRWCTDESRRSLTCRRRSRLSAARKTLRNRAPHENNLPRAEDLRFPTRVLSVTSTRGETEQRARQSRPRVIHQRSSGFFAM